MDNIIEININNDFHISHTTLAYLRKFALHIPEISKCVPNENHYFGLDELPSDQMTIDNELGKLSMQVRFFIKKIIASNLYAYELACTPQQHIIFEWPLGNEVMTFCRDNLISKQLISNYLKLFVTNKSKNNYIKAFRYGTMLRRLYKGIKTTDLTNEAFDIYNNIVNKTISKNDIEMILVHMDFELQDLESNVNIDELFPPIDIKYANQFLIQTYKSYLKI